MSNLSTTSTPVEGQILDASLETWGAELKYKKQNLDNATWDLIDHVANGYAQFGDAIYQYADEENFTLGYLRNCVTTGTNYPFTRRENLPPLSPSHFQATNSIKDEDQQDTALWQAHILSLNRDQFRDWLRERGLTKTRDYVELIYENDALENKNAELETKNGHKSDEITRLRETLEQITAERDNYQSEAEHWRASDADTSDDDDGWSPERLVCPECGCLIEREAL